MSSLERPNIRAMKGYTWGEQPEDPATIKLNTNENPFPPSPAVQETLRNLDAASLRIYPQPTADRLRDAIARLHGLNRDAVVVTNGGDEALRLAFTTFAKPGGVFGMAEPSYSLYPVLAEIQDTEIERVALRDDWTLPDDCGARLAAADLTCIVNPHAPSGALTPVDALRELADQLGGVLLVDEAYADFATGYDSRKLTALDNVLVLRTFSKGYSLAGLRLGYLLGSRDLIAPIIDKTRDSYNIDHVSQQLGLAAIEDQEHAKESWRRVRAMRDALRASLGQLGLTSPPSHANFILVTVPETAPLTARAIYEQLKAIGILVRYFDAPMLGDKLRISIGTEEQNEALVEGLTDLLTSPDQVD